MNPRSTCIKNSTLSSKARTASLRTGMASLWMCTQWHACEKLLFNTQDRIIRPLHLYDMLIQISPVGSGKSFFGGVSCKAQFNMPPAPSADKATQRKSATLGGAERLVRPCLHMSNAKVAARNTMARRANPTSRTSFCILSYHSSSLSAFAEDLPYWVSFSKTNK